jgi:hypothetical protein
MQKGPISAFLPISAPGCTIAVGCSIRDALI